MNKLLDRLSYRFRRVCIPNLMLYIIIAMAAVYVVELFVPEMPLSLYMFFSRDLILSGDWWRVITWIIIPDTDNPISLIFSLYFYYIIGSGLEREWGGFKFNLYYFMGVVFTIAAGFIAGYATNMFLYFSMFFAFAVLYPDFQVLLFFFLPIKIKWLAIVDLVFFIVMFIIGDWTFKAAIIAAMANFVLFFWEDFGKFIRNQIYYAKHRKNYKNNKFWK